MSRTLARWTALSITAALLIAANAFSQEKEQAKKKARRAERDRATAITGDRERASGVIVKAEPIRKGARSRSDDVEREKGQAFTHRLTINTAAVWRDWVRDQAGVDANAPPREAAKSGANSVATKGEPQSEDTLIVVDIGPQTKVETRFRQSTDETGKGAESPEEALASSKEDPAAEKAKTKGDAPKRREKRAERSKTSRYEADDLETGLFVEVDYHHQDARNVAASVTVLRPVGGSDSPGEPAKEKGKDRTKAKGKAKARAKDQ